MVSTKCSGTPLGRPWLMFSHKRCQDKKSIKILPYVINICVAIFNVSLHKKVLHLKSMKCVWWNKIFIHLTHFSYQNLNSFLKLPVVQSVPNTQHWNDAVSLYRLILKVIFACECHTAEWSNLMRVGVELYSQISCATQRLQLFSLHCFASAALQTP